jgi:sulfur-oxidizing protein SoxZ
MATADSRVSVPPEVRRGEAFEVRITIRHPMETGYRTNESGDHVARNVIRRFGCRYNGAPVFAARVTSGIAANPYFRFFITARESGTLEFDWIDDAGVRGEARAEVKVV